MNLTRNAYRILVGRLEGKKPLGRPRRKWEDNINMDLIDYLFSDGHVLHVRSETFAVRRRMNMVSDDYNGQMVLGDECGPNFLTFILLLWKNPGKNLNQKTDPTGDRRVRCLRQRYYSRPGGWKLRPASQLRPASSFSVACTLRMDFKFPIS